jgi:hypothetical protein
MLAIVASGVEAEPHRRRVRVEPCTRRGAEGGVGVHPTMPTRFTTPVKSCARIIVVFHDARTFADGFAHETFRALRDNDPVSHHDHLGWARGYWLVTRHADVQRVSRDSATFRNSPHPFVDDEMAEDDATMSELLISQDPPLHTKLRKLISKGFTPRRVTELEMRIGSTASSASSATATSAISSPTSRCGCRCTSSRTSSACPTRTASRSSTGPSSPSASTSR